MSQVTHEQILPLRSAGEPTLQQLWTTHIADRLSFDPSTASERIQRSVSDCDLGLQPDASCPKPGVTPRSPRRVDGNRCRHRLYLPGSRRIP